VFLAATIVYFIALMDIQHRQEGDTIGMIVTDYLVGLALIGVTMYLAYLCVIDFMVSKFL
jgi:hypothetical protein